MRYAPYFCEENVWHLARDRAAEPGERYAVFVLGADPTCPRVAVWAQRVARGEPYIFWDYHVVLFERSSRADEYRVWDFDTTLGTPIPAAQWIDGSFPMELPGWPARFRIVEAEEYLRTFSSDRRHMRTSGGAEMPPFPSWPPILDAHQRHLLPRFLDARDAFLGEVCDLAGLRARFAAGNPSPEN
jgi:hypothetical protein